VREVLEETGIRTRVLAFLTTVDLDMRDGDASFSYAIHEHLCEPVESIAAPCPGDDAADARWVLPAELESLGVSPAARAIVSLGITRARARAGAG
jgi:8-oxo-dGTP pyrophosphatase MutT (NUDIX family)